MRIILLTLCLAFAVYTLAVYKYGSNAPAKSDTRIAAGWNIWQEKNCQSCHQLYGLGGYLGPDLTNVASEKEKAYIRAIIQSGTGRMPNFHLKPSEVESVVAFLSWVDSSGVSKVNDSAVHWSGSYIISAR